MARPTRHSGQKEQNEPLKLAGIAPVDPKGAEVLARSGKPQDKAMLILVAGGTIVRCTHPGRVGRVEKLTDGTFTVEVVATDSILDLQTRKDAPFTRYSNLGNVEVVANQAVGVGQQVGTAAFRDIARGATIRSGDRSSGIRYQVFANGSGTKASERFPESEEAHKINRQSQPDGEVPKPDKQQKEAPPEAGDNDRALNESEIDETTLDNVGTTNAPYFTKPQVRFVEQKNQVFNHDFLVYINGVEVTQYITGTVTINLVDKDGWNEANFVLNNAANNFVITLENLGFNEELNGKFRTQDIPGEEKYSERAKKEMIDYKNDSKRNPFVDVAKQQLIQAGLAKGVSNAAPTGQEEQLAGQNISESAKATRRDKNRNKLDVSSEGLIDRRWQLGFQSTVFHKNDPVRIFRKNPLREADEWMPAFTGYLNQISYDTNYINGLSTVKLSCYDIRAIAQKMRVQTTSVTAITNPRAIFRGREEAGSQSLFTDLLDPTIQGNPLSGKKFEDVMEFLITGTTTDDSNINDAFGQSKFKRGIGDFTVGDKILYSPGDSKNGEAPDPLEHWHALCLFGMDGRRIRRGDRELTITGGASKTTLTAEMNRRWLTKAEARTIGANTTHDGQWSPHRQYVHFLLPAAGTGAKNLLDSDALNANSNQLDFRSRLDIMQDFCNRIDYQFWVTPIGDFVVEFPMYDFYPEDFQEYKTVFQVDKHLKSDNIQDEAGEMITAVIAHGRIRAERDVDVGAEQFQPKAVVVSPMMMMRYGVVEHELTLPFIATADALARIAQIEFQKKLAMSNKMDIAFDYRPFITPNRPIEHMERKRMGLTTAVRNDMQLFAAGDTSITTRYVRRQIFRNGGGVAYTFIFSGVSMPITYREIYAPGTISPVTGGQAGSPTVAVSDLTSETGNSAIPLVSDPVLRQADLEKVNFIAAKAAEAASPVQAPAAQARFMALGQQNSGWNPTNRTPDGRFGIFALSSEYRTFFGIGDSTDVGEQTEAADSLWRGLVNKYTSLQNEAIANAKAAGVQLAEDTEAIYNRAAQEFSEGVDAVKNVNLREEWDEGVGAVNAALAAKWEEVSQPLIEAYGRLFPGEPEPTDVTAEVASDPAKAALTAADEAGPLPSGRGFQTNQGIIAFDNREEIATRSTEPSATEVQAIQNQPTLAPKRTAEELSALLAEPETNEERLALLKKLTQEKIARGKG